MTRRRRAPWFVWLRCAGPVRVLRVRPGDTLIVTLPERSTPALAQAVCRQLEEAVGLGNDVVAVTGDIGLTTLRPGTP